MIKKLSRVLAALAMSAAVIIAGCSSEGGSSKGPATVAATGVTVTDGNGSSVGNLFIGEEDTITLTATVTPENATVKKVEWVVSDTEAVEIVEQTDSSCKIKGKKAADGVTVTAKVTGSKVVGSYTVNVGSKLASIKVELAENVKKAYTFKETFDSTGVTVKAVYSDDSEKDVSENAVFAFGENKASELNTYQNADSVPVFVSYTENGVTKESENAIYTVSVNTGDWKLGDITIETTGAKAEYIVGEDLDKNGVTATGYMVNTQTSEKDPEPVNLTAQLVFDGFDSSASFLGTEDSHVLTKTQTINVKYDEENKTSYNVTINAIPVTSVTLSDSTLSIYKNKEKTVTVTVLPENATFKKVNWSVTGNEADYVTVTDVEGGKKIAAGETVTESPVTVTVTLADNAEKTASCAVSVKEQPKVTAWDFTSWSSETQANIAADAAWVEKGDGTKRYTMNIDGEAVANSAVIKELEGIDFDKAATVTISFDSSQGNYVQTATSMEIPVEGGYEITFSASNTGSKNGTRKLVVTEGNETTTVISSENKTKVTGKYTPKAGTSSIVVSFPDGALNVYSIKGPVHATGLSLAIDGSNSVTLKEGVAKDITATITPSDAAEKEITWTSDKPAIVKVENGKITPLAVSGETVTITGELSNGVSATFTVNGVAETVKPTSIEVTYANETSLERLVVGYSKTLNVSYNPENVEAKALTWSSSNPEAVSVIDGVIKGLAKSGSAVTITATTVNGKTATFVINTVIEPSEVADSLVITKEGGWFRSVYAEWIPSSDAAVTGYNAYVVKGNDKTKIDKELIRKYSDHYRVDALGLSAGDYQIEVVAVIGSEESEIMGTTGTVKAVADDRQGFAFKDGAEPGAYKADGTLKEGATVVYVTEENKKTVTATIGGTTYTGIAAITQAVKIKNNAQPFDFRIVGMVTMDGLVCADMSSAYAMGVKTAANVTIEGVGEDATLNGVGLAAFEESNNIEFCNVALYDWRDDGIALKNTSHAWIHNCDIFYGHPGSAKDQVKGDGSMDLKDDSKYVTISYLHFYDSGKMSLCGMKSESGSNWIDYHHNWFDHSDSRHPRIRTMSVHVWNNYYDGNSKYGVGAAKDSEAFVENNYFRGTKYPMMSSLQGTDALGDGTFSSENGGVIKSFNNYMVGQASYITYQQNSDSFDAYEALTRDEQVPAAAAAKVGGKVYSNFDTNPTNMHGPYTPDATMQVPDIVMGKVEGRIGAGRMNGGDLSWSFTEADDASYDINDALKAYVLNYVSPVKETYATASSVYNKDGVYDGGNPTDPEAPSDPVAPSLTLDKTTATVEVGSTVKITATAKNGSGSVEWTTTDNTIASVSNGTVTGLKAGTATITAKYGDLTKTCTVTVKEPVVFGAGTYILTWAPANNTDNYFTHANTSSTTRAGVSIGGLDITKVVKNPSAITFTCKANAEVQMAFEAGGSNTGMVIKNSSGDAVYTSPFPGSKGKELYKTTLAAGGTYTLEKNGTKDIYLSGVLVIEQ